MPTKLSEAATPKFSHDTRRHFLKAPTFLKKTFGNSHIVQEFTILLSIIYIEK